MGQILSQRFANEHWLFQCQEAVKEAVQRCHDQLRQGGVTQNEQADGYYRFEARTADELKATQDQVPALVRPANVEQPQEQVDERPEQRDSDGPVPWML